MTAHSVIRTFTPAEQAATELSLRLHALWKALEAVPLPRLAAWAELAWHTNAFRDWSSLDWTARRPLLAARIVAPSELDRWIKLPAVYYLDLMPEELALARARVGGVGPLLQVRKALDALVPYTGIQPAISRIRRPPSNAPLILAVEDLELALVAAGLDVAASAATALRLRLLGLRQHATRWIDVVVGDGAAPWLWVWTGDPSGLADQVRADLAKVGESLASHVVEAVEVALVRLLSVAGLPPDATGAARREARREAFQALADALHAEGRRHRSGEVVFFLAQLDGRLDELAATVRLPRTMRGSDGLSWVRRSDVRRLRGYLSPVATLPRVAEALAALEALP